MHPTLENLCLTVTKYFTKGGGVKPVASHIKINFIVTLSRADLNFQNDLHLLAQNFYSAVHVMTMFANLAFVCG